MKQNKVKKILGATIVLAALTNAHANQIGKSKKLTDFSSASKISDKTNSQDSISDGSKTEHAGK